MNHQTQNTLTILLSSIFFGLAGFWLIPGRAEGAIVGAAAGATAASGHVQQNKRLRQLASQQKQLSAHQQEMSTTYQEQVRNLVELVRQAERTIEGISFSTIEHEKKLKELELKMDSVLFNQTNSADEDTTIADSSSTSEQEDTMGGEAAQAVIEWLKTKQIEVENYYEPDATIDNLLDGLSLYLGNNYATLNRFHWRLRNGVGRRLHFDLGNYNTQEKNIHNQFLKRLQSCDYLSRGRIIKNQDRSDFIIAALHNRNDIQGFFNGGWFERFIYSKIIGLLDSEGIEYQCLRNPKIAYPNEENSPELDLLFLVNGKPLLIECKAGQNHDEGIAKFVKHQENLGLNSSNAIFVVLDIPEAEARLRSKNWNITVTDQNRCIDRIRDLITTEDRSPSSIDSIADESRESNRQDIPVAANGNNLANFFKQRELNLAPEFRSRVLNELILLMEQLEQPISFSEMTGIIRDRMKEGVGLGRGKICEILNCLRFSDFFHNDRNLAVQDVSEKLYSIVSVDQNVLEAKCMEFYAKQVLQLSDPNFFDVKENVQEFERLTLGKAPSQEKIKHMKEH